MRSFNLETRNYFDPLAAPTSGPATLPSNTPLSYTLRTLPPALIRPQRISPSPRIPTIRKRTTRTTSTTDTVTHEAHLHSSYAALLRIQRYFYAVMPSEYLPRASVMCVRAMQNLAAEVDVNLAASPYAGMSTRSLVALQYVQWLHTRDVVVKPLLVHEAIGNGEQELEWEKRRAVVEELKERIRVGRREQRIRLCRRRTADAERLWRELMEEEREVQQAEKSRGLCGVLFRGRHGAVEGLQALVSQGVDVCSEEAGDVFAKEWDWIQGYVGEAEGPADERPPLVEEFHQLVLDDRMRRSVESWSGNDGEELEGDESDDSGTVIYTPSGSEEEDD